MEGFKAWRKELESFGGRPYAPTRKQPAGDGLQAQSASKLIARPALNRRHPPLCCLLTCRDSHVRYFPPSRVLLFVLKNRRGAAFRPRRRKSATAISKTSPSSYLPILKTFVPHTEHVPLVAGLPFFIVTALGSLTSRLALHLTQ